MNLTAALPAPLRDHADRAVRTAAGLLALPGRILSMVASAEHVIGGAARALEGVEALIAAIEALIVRIEAVVGEAAVATERAGATITHVESATTRADLTVAQAEKATAAAGALLTDFAPTLITLEPTLRRLAETTSPDEVDALVALIDRLPILADAVQSEVIPLLHRLDEMGPDLHQLLAVVDDLHSMISRMPVVGRRMRAANVVDHTELPATEAQRETDNAR